MSEYRLNNYDVKVADFGLAAVVHMHTHARARTHTD